MDGAGALLPLFDIECDSKALVQRIECRAFDPRSMEEDLAPIVSRDEPKSALLYHPFDFPRCHDVALSRVRVVSCRPFPISTVMHPLRPFTQPSCGEGTIQRAGHRWIVRPPPPCIRLPGSISPPGHESRLIASDWPSILSTWLHEVPSSWPRGARSSAPHSDHKRQSSCHRVGCMEDRCPLCESIEIGARFVKQYPHLRSATATRRVGSPWDSALPHRILRGSRASRKPSPM
jgi:hypothetical protein